MRRFEEPRLCSFFSDFMGAAGSISGGYQIPRSLRFNSADSSHLSKAFGGSPTSDTKRDISFWVKQVVPSALNSAVIRGNSDGTGQGDGIKLSNGYYGGTSNMLRVSCAQDTGVLWTTELFRDTTAHVHIYVKIDTTQGTANNRMRIWKSGVEITSFVSRTNPALNASIQYGSASFTQYIGRFLNAYGDMYLSEYIEVDGGGTAVTDFGGFSAITGAWDPKSPVVSDYGASGFKLNFSDNSNTTAATLGADSAPVSGNHSAANNWTPNNFSVSAGTGNDSLTDTPTNYGTDTGAGGEVRGNYAVATKLTAITSNITVSNGGLEIRGDGTTADNVGTIPFEITVPTYWEAVIDVPYASGGHEILGLVNEQAGLVGAKNYGVSNTWWFFANGTKRHNTTDTATNLSWQGAGEVVMLAFDPSSKKLWAGINGTWADSGNPATGANPLFTVTGNNFFPGYTRSGSSTTGYFLNFGQRPFAYAAPSGFKALCTQNLSDPAIKKPSAQFTPTLYTGTGSSLSISGVNFSPDLVWIKSRSAATDHALYDAQRGAQARLESNTTDAEATSDNGLTAFNSDGFTLGTLAQVNTSSATYVAWLWNESVTAGFDIVLYTGTGSAHAENHNLGVAPSLMVAKSRSETGTSWHVYHVALGATKRMLLDSTDAATTSATSWNNTEPTSTQFTIGTSGDINTNGSTNVAYLWTPIAQFSAFGSYTGNGSTDGPVAAVGFRPAYAVTRIYTTSNSWFVQDAARSPFNVAKEALELNDSGAEVTTNRDIDFLSSAFKIRNSNNAQNASGGGFIFISFAETAGKYARAR